MKKIEAMTFKTSFTYLWPAYIVLPVVFGFSISYLLNQVHQPLANQKVNIFLAASEVNGDKLTYDFEEKFKSDGLKKAETVSSVPGDFVFLQKLKTVGYASSDLFILPESCLKDINMEDTFLQMNSDFLLAYNSSDRKTYVSGEQTYGILLKGQDETSFLSSYMKFNTEDYYIFVNVTSKNISSYGMYDIKEDDLALKVMKYLMEGK